MSLKRHRATVRACVGASIAWLTLAWGSVASASPASFGLSWSSSAEKPCFTRDELEQAVAMRLGRNPFSPVGRAELVLEGRELPAVSGRLRARVEERDRQGRLVGARDLEAASCAELQRSAAFVVVLIVDPEAAFGAPAPAPPFAPPPAPPEAPPPEAEAQPAVVHPKQRLTRPTPKPRRAPPPAPKKERAAHGYLGAGVALSSGLLPKLDVGPIVTVGVAPLPLPLYLEWRGSYRSSLAEVRGGYDFAALEQQWRVCLLGRTGAGLGGAVCAGASWISILPSTEGLTDGDASPKGIFGPVVAARPTLQLGTVVLFAEFAVVMLRPRYSFSYRDDEGRRKPLHEVAPFGTSLAIGAVRTF
ncbi:MAG: hypothetical protein K0S65_4499 [Labilithrix sp.]|nr:hypothetical protein [Labilithrix sp.]